MLCAGLAKTTLQIATKMKMATHIIHGLHIKTKVRLAGIYVQPTNSQLQSNMKVFVGLTINNVTNRHNTITNTDGSLESEIGRQFIADVTFKF